MAEVSKKERFIHFLDKALDNTCEQLGQNLITGLTEDKKLSCTISVSDIGFNRCLSLNSKKMTKCKTMPLTTDCAIVFDEARTVHHLLSGKILPTNISLIGKMKMFFNNEDSKVFERIIIPASNHYSELIKGTRFTLKKK
jgi:hypothetical protein